MAQSKNESLFLVDNDRYEWSAQWHWKREREGSRIWCPESMSRFDVPRGKMKTASTTEAENNGKMQGWKDKGRKEERKKGEETDRGSRKQGRVWRCKVCGLCEGNKLQMSGRRGKERRPSPVHTAAQEPVQSIFPKIMASVPTQSNLEPNVPQTAPTNSPGHCWRFKPLIGAAEAYSQSPWAGGQRPGTSQGSDRAPNRDGVTADEFPVHSYEANSGYATNNTCSPPPSTTLSVEDAQRWAGTVVQQQPGTSQGQPWRSGLERGKAEWWVVPQRLKMNKIR